VLGVETVCVLACALAATSKAVMLGGEAATNSCTAAASTCSCSRNRFAAAVSSRQRSE